jgi:hypothetical protein
VIVKVPTLVPLLTSFNPAPTQRSPVMGKVVEGVAVINQPQRLQRPSSSNSVVQHDPLPMAVPRSQLPGGGDDTGGHVVVVSVLVVMLVVMVVVTLVSVTVVTVVVGLGTVVVVTVTVVSVTVVTVVVGLGTVVVVMVVVVTVGVTGQVVMVVVHSFRMARSPGERRLRHVRLINST